MVHAGTQRLGLLFQPGMRRGAERGRDGDQQQDHGRGEQNDDGLVAVASTHQVVAAPRAQPHHRIGAATGTGAGSPRCMVVPRDRRFPSLRLSKGGCAGAVGSDRNRIDDPGPFGPGWPW